jgi:hypothetical protein
MLSPGRQEIRHLVWKLKDNRKLPGNLHSYRYGPEVPKQWGVPPRGRCCSSGGGVSFLYEGHIYFERNMDAR